MVLLEVHATVLRGVALKVGNSDRGDWGGSVEEWGKMEDKSARVGDK